MSSIRPDQHLPPPAGHLLTAVSSEALYRESLPEFLSVPGGAVPAGLLHPAAPRESWSPRSHGASKASAQAAVAPAATASHSGAAGSSLVPSLAKDKKEGGAPPWGAPPLPSLGCETCPSLTQPGSSLGLGTKTRNKLGKCCAELHPQPRGHTVWAWRWTCVIPELLDWRC